MNKSFIVLMLLLSIFLTGCFNNSNYSTKLTGLFANLYSNYDDGVLNETVVCEIALNNDIITYVEFSVVKLEYDWMELKYYY